MTTKMSFEYDIAISFAGKVRKTAEEFAGKLTNSGVNIFYDEFHEAISGVEMGMITLFFSARYKRQE